MIVQNIHKYLRFMILPSSGFHVIELISHSWSVYQFIALLFGAGELLISLQDVAFLLSRASFSTTFYNNCGKNECLWTTTYLKTVIRCMQGHAPCKKFSLSVKFFGDHIPGTKMT